jgi:hypothetical protein
VRLLLVGLIVSCATANALTVPEDPRRTAIHRALDFLSRSASDDAVFSQHGFDLLWAFYSISHTARDPQLRQSAAHMGHELALRWRKSHQHVPDDAGPKDIYKLVMGACAADHLGVPDPQLKAELLQAAGKFNAEDYLGFDALHGPPRLDDPQRYDVWSGALIKSYVGDAYGVTLGAHYRDVVKWLPSLRSYNGHDDKMEFDIFYAITHVIYTLNHYNERRIANSLLPDEIAFLRRKLKAAIAEEDPEMVGEALDCLKAAGFERDAQVEAGVKFLIATQHADGAWAEDDDGGYTAYHSAWTGLDGLRDYHFHGMVKRLPK